MKEKENMTTYLTKKDGDKIFHFRVTIDETIIKVVQGQCFNNISKWTKGCGTNEKAISEANELIDEKLKEGFKKTEFKESKENTYDVYDKAKYHYGGEFPEGLDDYQGFVHTGMYFGWIIDNGLISEDRRDDLEDNIERFKKREMTGTQIYEAMDGVLAIEDMNELGNKFSLDYFDFETGEYVNDYDNTLAKGLPSMFHVQDTWDNYDKLKKVIDKRFEEWKKGH